MAILKIKDEEGMVIEIPAIRGPEGPEGPIGPTGPRGLEGPRGPSGVYVGNGDMPYDCNVQVIPGEGGLGWVPVIDGKVLDLEDLGEDVSVSSFTTDFPIFEGRTYKVVFNGKEYTCRSYLMMLAYDPDYRAICLGDPSLCSWETPDPIFQGDGEISAPFGFCYNSAGDMWTLYTREIDSSPIFSLFKYEAAAALRVKDEWGNVSLVPVVGLPVVKLTAIHADGTTKTFTLYGEVTT